MARTDDLENKNILFPADMYIFVKFNTSKNTPINFHNYMTLFEDNQNIKILQTSSKFQGLSQVHITFWEYG